MRRPLALAALVAAVALIAVIVSGLNEARSMPIERRTTIAVRGWPSGTPPVRLALLSDIHLGNRAMDAGRLRAIVARVNAARPDLVVIAGDFVTGHDATGARERAAALTAPLARLRAPLGVVAVLGNHDHWTAPGAVRSALRAAGIVVLANDAVRRGPLAIAGIDDGYSGHDDVARTLAAARRLGGRAVVLTHSPDVAGRLGPGFPLLLAGHTHCGQIVLPWFGAVANHGLLERGRRIYDPRYRCGIVRDPGRLVVVTAGLGSGTVPLRIGAPPDWWLVTLAPPPPTA